MPTPPRSLKQLFLDALAVPPSEREVWLARECPNASIRQHVELMLAAHDMPQSLLDRVAPNVSVGTVTEDLWTAAIPLGTSIGPYKLLEQIGEGGFGVVYMAEQSEPVRRKVALKVLKPGMDTRQVVARFEAERQALAIMDHPNIARVFDGGATPSGRPYFVMELVKGTPITQFCDQNHLTPRQRLELFVPVCQAIQHAHQKGIIHRDLKPSNVLVTVHDTTPVVKVIDFGISKALGQELTDKTLFTGFAQMIGTPLYMSPEQAGQSSLDIDTRSDIYSLGVLLYELLTGSTPFDKDRFKQAAYDEIRRIIREEEPPKPSTRISQSRDALPSLSAQRQTEPAKLSKIMRGELDWIVMKALDKDRNRRYETANGFARDIERYLSDEPVQACPPSAVYRFRKFLRKNKAAIAIAGLAILVLLVVSGGIVWNLSDRAIRQTRVSSQVSVIVAEADRLEETQQWSEALAAMKRADAVAQSGGADAVTVDQIRKRIAGLAFIDRLAEIRLSASTTERDGFDYATVDRNYARAFREFGVDVDRLTDEAAIERLRVYPTLAIPLGSALDDWSLVRDAVWQPKSGVREDFHNISRAIDPEPVRNQIRSFHETHSLESLDELTRLAESLDVVQQDPTTLDILSRVLLGRGRSAAAERLLRKSQQAFPDDFWLNFNLAYHRSQAKDVDGAIRFYTSALSLRPNSAATRANLAQNLIKQNKSDEALSLLRRSIELDPHLARGYDLLGIAQRELRMLDKSVASHQRAVELNRKSGKVDPEHAIPFDHLGITYRLLKQYDEAITAHRTSIKLNPEYPGYRSNLGIALHEKGELQEAIACYREALAIDPKSAAAYVNLGKALSAQKKPEEAIDCYRKAIEFQPDDAAAYNNMGVILAEKKRYVEAADCFRKAISFERTLVDAHNNLGLSLSEQGQYQDAIASFRTALSLSPHLQSGAHLSYALSRQCEALHSQGNNDQALAAANEAIQLQPDKSWGFSARAKVRQQKNLIDLALADHGEAIRFSPKDAYYRYNRALLYSTLGRWKEAADDYQISVEVYPANLDAWRLLACARLASGDVAGYRLACREMVARFGGTSDVIQAERTAKTCSLIPDAVPSFNSVEKLAERAVTGTEKHGNRRYFVLAKGMADYRAGKYVEAVSWLDQFSPSAGAWENDTIAFAVLAMAQQRLGKSEEAAASLAKAKAIVEMKFPDVSKGETFGGGNWHDWIAAQLLIREAAKIVATQNLKLE